MHRLRLAFEPTVMLPGGWKHEWCVVSCRMSNEFADVVVRVEEKRVGQKRLVLLSPIPLTAGPADPFAILTSYLEVIPEDTKCRRARGGG